MKFEAGKVYTHKKLLDTKIYVKSLYRCPISMVSYMRVMWLTKSGRILADDEFRRPDEKNEDWFEC